MKVGIPSEIKNREYRVALTPAGVHHLVASGHEVLVEAGAGAGSAISDEDYLAAGARWSHRRRGRGRAPRSSAR